MDLETETSTEFHRLKNRKPNAESLKGKIVEKKGSASAVNKDANQLVKDIKLIEAMAVALGL